MLMERSSPSELLIRQRLAALTRVLPAAQRGDVRSLHHARVATRRLREALPLLVSGTRARKLERVVRRLTRALGPVRELDVALINLDELERDGEVPSAALSRLREAVGEERRRLHAEMRRTVEDIDLDKLTKRAVSADRKTRIPARGVCGILAPRVHGCVRPASHGGACAIANARLCLPDRLHGCASP